MGELERFKVKAETEEQNKELARSFFSTIDALDFEKPRNLMAGDFKAFHPSAPTPLGLEEAFQVIRDHYAAFPDWRYTIELLIADGDKVSVRISQQGTQKGVYEGIQPTGATVTMPAQVILVISGGKVKEFWGVEDYLGFYRQLGMELRRKETEG